MDKKVAKGDLIIMTSGDYSDYVIDTLCRALADFDIEEVRQEYLAQFPEEAVRYKFSDTHFKKWLIVDKRLLEELQAREWNFDSYDGADYEIKPVDFEVK
jgi:hypothetical protein